MLICLERSLVATRHAVAKASGAFGFPFEMMLAPIYNLTAFCDDEKKSINVKMIECDRSISVAGSRE